ncbi:hypothetical protein FCV25MIE_16291, partial [Fagus crenata]
VVGKLEPCCTFIYKFLSVYYTWQPYQQCIRILYNCYGFRNQSSSADDFQLCLLDCE